MQILKDNWEKLWKTNATKQNIVWATKMPNSNTNNTSMKTKYVMSHVNI